MTTVMTVTTKTTTKLNAQHQLCMLPWTCRESNWMQTKPLEITFLSLPKWSHLLRYKIQTKLLCLIYWSISDTTSNPIPEVLSELSELFCEEDIDMASYSVSSGTFTYRLQTHSTVHLHDTHNIYIYCCWCDTLIGQCPYKKITKTYAKLQVWVILALISFFSSVLSSE